MQARQIFWVRRFPSNYTVNVVVCLAIISAVFVRTDENFVYFPCVDVMSKALLSQNPKTHLCIKRGR